MHGRPQTGPWDIAVTMPVLPRPPEQERSGQEAALPAPMAEARLQ